MDRRDFPIPHPEKPEFPKMMFMAETDGYGRNIKAEGAQLRLDKNDWSHLLVFPSPDKSKLALIRPDETDQQEIGQAWFIYGDRDTSQLFIKSVAGKFTIPNQTILVDKSISHNIFSYTPDRKSDLVLEEKTLQPIALIYKDHSTQEFVLARRLLERIDTITNTVSFDTSNFDLTYPNAQEIKAASKFIADFQREQHQENIHLQMLKVIKENAHITALRLAHKNSKLPHELKPEIVFNDMDKQYEITLYVSKNGKNRIIGKTDPLSDNAGSQIGNDFGFGSRLIFNQNSKISSDPEQEITGSIDISQYSDTQNRQQKPLIDNIRIKKCTDRTLSIPIISDEPGSEIYKVTFASNRAENILEALIGIERGLKPKYMGPNEVFGS